MLDLAWGMTSWNSRENVYKAMCAPVPRAAPRHGIMSSNKPNALLVDLGWAALIHMVSALCSSICTASRPSRTRPRCIRLWKGLCRELVEAPFWTQLDKKMSKYTTGSYCVLTTGWTKGLSEPFPALTSITPCKAYKHLEVGGMVDTFHYKKFLSTEYF